MNSHSRFDWGKLLHIVLLIMIMASLTTTSDASAKPFAKMDRGIYDYDDPLCTLANRQHVWVGPWYMGTPDVPLYWPIHEPAAATLDDEVKIRFQYWSDNFGQTTLKAYYRVETQAAYDPNLAFSELTNLVQVGQVGNNRLMEATIPSMASMGITSPVRVDYYVRAWRGSYSCETVGENPFDYDKVEGVEHHIFSLTASPKQTGRIYQLFVRTFGAEPNDPNWQPGDKPAAYYTHSGAFCDITDDQLDSIQGMGFDYIWLTGVIDFDNASSHRKGDAGSPYAVRNYYRVSPDLACLEENHHRYDQAASGDAQTDQATRDFMDLLNRIHSRGMKVMVDLVPNHTSQVYSQTIVSRVYEWEPEVFQLTDNNYQFQYGASGVKIIGNSNLVFPNGSNDWTDTHRLDYTNDRTACGSWMGDHCSNTDPVTSQSLRAGNGCDNSNPVEGCAPGAHSTYQILDRVIETWQSRGVDGFRIDFPHALADDLWSFLTYNAKTRAAGYGRNGGSGAQYPGEVFIVGEGYDLDGWFGPDSGAIGNTGSNWANLYAGGFDGVYDKSGMYEQIRNIHATAGTGNHWWANGIVTKYQEEIGAPWTYSRVAGNVGLTGATHMLRFLSNHDELQPASNEYNGNYWGSPNMLIPKAGTAAAFLLPGSALMYNGQEVGEPASVDDSYYCAGAGYTSPGNPQFNPWCGTTGKTSIFDYVFMPSIYRWQQGSLDATELALQNYYRQLVEFSDHIPTDGNYFDITHHGVLNGDNPEWVYAYARTATSTSGYGYGMVIISNFSETEIPLSLGFKYNNGNSLLEGLGIENDPGKNYIIGELVNVAYEDGTPRPESQRVFYATGSQLYAGNTISIVIPRWSTSVLYTSENCVATQSALTPTTITDPPDWAKINQTLDGLRLFRDKVLKTTTAGDSLVTLYYKNSPEMTRIILKNPYLGRQLWDILVQGAPALVRYVNQTNDPGDLLTKDLYTLTEKTYTSFKSYASSDLASVLKYYWTSFNLKNYINQPLDKVVADAVRKFVLK